MSKDIAIIYQKVISCEAQFKHNYFFLKSIYSRDIILYVTWLRDKMNVLRR
jgi:hypothetical protein